ncbi:MAG: valine--tRNA ligase [Candidatus Thermoplasmatota archaeon]|jgi:valyl-tRNA synthetase|nr:valine--tRNA ligase [Candidatus Thermoplasmatota archaeon]
MTEYDQKAFEAKWQTQWQEMKIYHFDFSSKKKPYSIDVPPRYASGPLHAGHAVHYTHIDFAARYKRMRGYNVFFPLCFDVNGIPIEERVERQLNITRKDIDRHKFTKLCSEFAQKNIATMTSQFIRLGESMDPSIYYQTDAEYYRRITQISFIELFKKGHIYKGEFPVNWCPRCMTAMADAEVVYSDRTTKLNTIKFYFTKPPEEQLLKFHGIGKDAHGVYIEIATTRPEMLAACQIVAVHPTDERAPWLVGQTVKVPTVNKEVNIVEDDAVDPEFGTGLVMICTVGDKEDLNWVFKYKLPLEMSIDEEGKMTALTGKYKGMKIEDARKTIIQDMTLEGLLLKQEPLAQNVGVCWRCKTPVEFINAKQWFLKTIPFKQLVLDASDAMHWYPQFMKIRLEDWVNSLEWDWVISRQRYFATPIPLWECEKCGEVVLARAEDCYVDPTIDKPPVQTCPKCGGPLKGCEDVFDTWMDSSISPLYNTFWHRDEKNFKHLYPMSVRPQSHDIIRTWAFYTILRCSLLTDEKPFEDIMMGGFILSEDGTPMHASLGNVIDPLHIIDEFGTDAFRCYAASCALGEDNPFRKKDVVRGTKLLRKLWNVQQFIGNIIKEGKPPKPQHLQGIDQWILTKYSKLVTSCTQQMDVFDYSPAMKDIEYFLWHELADHYLEMIKGSLYNKENVESIRYTLYTIGLGVVKLFAPFFPHITEEIYQESYKTYEGDVSIHLSAWPQPILIDEEKEQAGETVKEYIAKIRAWKSEQGIALNAPLPALATYAPEELIARLKENQPIISSTLRFPSTHLFIPGKPEIQETITTIEPLFSKLGPTFKNDSSIIVQWIKTHQEELIKTIENGKDKPISEIPGVNTKTKETLHKSGYLQIKRDVGVKGKKGSTIVSFDGYYVELERKTP